MDQTYDWGRFTVRINVNAPVEQLYKGWATRKGIEYWFLRESLYQHPDGSALGENEFVSKNDSYTWKWHGYPDTTTEKGLILDANGKDLFKFQFGKAGICSVTIRKEMNETIIELVQDEIPLDEKGKMYYHVGCKTGWTFYFANMKSMYEGGIDLRNRNEHLQEMLNS